MDYQMEQASIQAKALQILNTKELFISQSPIRRNELKYDSSAMDKQFESFGNSIKLIKSPCKNNEDSEKFKAMKDVYEELLGKCDKYSKTIMRLKSDMSKITGEYDKNIELLLKKIDKNKNDKTLKDIVKKFNKKILSYKVKIRNLEETLISSEKECEELRVENQRIKQEIQQNSYFKQKLSILKSEYESKIKMIIDEVKESEFNNEYNNDPQLKLHAGSNIPTRSNSSNSIEAAKMKKCQSTCQLASKESCQKYSRYFSSTEAKDYYKNNSRSKQITEEGKSKSSMMRGSKSPENIDKISLIANREKYKQYRELRKNPSNDFNSNREHKTKSLLTFDKSKSCQFSKIKCSNCGSKINPEDYSTHNSKCKIEHIYEMIDEEVEENQSSEFLQNPMLFTSRRSSMEFGK